MCRFAHEGAVGSFLKHVFRLGVSTRSLQLKRKYLHMLSDSHSSVLESRISPDLLHTVGVA